MNESGGLTRQLLAVDSYRNGKSAAAIAAELGVSVPTVFKWIKRAGATKRQLTKVKIDRELVAAMFSAGGTVKTIAKATGSSETGVRNSLQSMGIYEKRTGAGHPLRVAEPKRRCKECGETKASTEFEIYARDTLNTVCLSCSGDFELQARLRVTGPRQCSKCSNIVPASEFYDPTSFICKRCHNAATRVWVSKNKDRRAANVLNWQRANKDKCSAANKRRRARKLGAPVVDFTETQWLELLEEHGHSCAYCGITGVKLERDHVIPLTRGGSDTKSNIAPACRTCNSSKNHRTVEEWRAGITVPRKTG
jgi:hypothetical protein